MYDAKTRTMYLELFKTAEAGLGVSLRSQLSSVVKESALADAIKSGGGTR
jgi:hypothetical protein